MTAGGAGSRAGTPLPKLELPLLGRPLVYYALLAFEQAVSIERVILVVPAERLGAWGPDRLAREGLAKVTATLAGGDTRQQSVRNAIDAIPERRGTVVIHDGARPLVTAGLIDSVADIPDQVDGLIAAVPVTDTIKVVDVARVTGTPDRSSLVAVQTPQAFRLEVLRASHQQASSDGFVATDDSALVERWGGTVQVVAGDRENLKVTYPEDVKRAEEILMARGIG